MDVLWKNQPGKTGKTPRKSTFDNTSRYYLPLIFRHGNKMYIATYHADTCYNWWKYFYSWRSFLSWNTKTVICKYQLFFSYVFLTDEQHATLKRSNISHSRNVGVWGLGLYSLRRRRLTGIGIPIINLRRSDDRLRCIMGIPILIRRRLLSE